MHGGRPENTSTLPHARLHLSTFAQNTMGGCVRQTSPTAVLVQSTGVLQCLNTTQHTAVEPRERLTWRHFVYHWYPIDTPPCLVGYIQSQSSTMCAWVRSKPALKMKFSSMPRTHQNLDQSIQGWEGGGVQSKVRVER